MKKQVLILGGTQFIGRSIVERLCERSDMELTLFNRQRTGADLFPRLNKIKGDRLTDDVEQFANREWDLVIDGSGVGGAVFLP